MHGSMLRSSKAGSIKTFPFVDSHAACTLMHGHTHIALL